MAIDRQPTNEAFFDVLKIHRATRGDIYLVMFPELFRPTGLHFSIHGSGSWHVGTEKPHLNYPLPRMEELSKHFQDNASGIFEAMVKPPKPGYPALIWILPDPEGFVVTSRGNRYILDASAALDASTIAAVDDTANLADALLQLRTTGYIDRNSAVTIISLESGEISIYRPWDTACEADVRACPTWQRELSKYRGFIATFETPSHGSLPRCIETPVFKPLLEPMEELFESLPAQLPIGCSPKIRKFERHLEELGKRAQRKEVLHLS
jgi:hypothetical protein